MLIARTSRLILRRFQTSDAPFILKLLNEPSYHANIGDRGIRTLEDAEDYCVTVLQRMYLENGYGLYLMALAEGDCEGKAIGFCGLVNREGLEGTDLGYAMFPLYWGNGYAREASLAVMHHAKWDVGLERLAAIVSKHNAASSALLDRLGFSLTGDFTYPETGEILNLYHRDLNDV